MHNNIVNFLIQFISRWGCTKVVVLYLSLVFSFITFTVVSITIEPQRIKIVCGSMSFLNILALIIITYPISLYLRQTRQLRINKGTDIFATVYLPNLEYIFSLLNIEEYSIWSYYVSNSGQFKLKVTQYENLDKLVRFIKSRNQYQEFEKWDKLIANLGLIADLIKVWDEHIKSFGDDYYTIESFYKTEMYDHNYNEKLEANYNYCFLIGDLILELTRLSNLILNKVRDKYPNFLVNIGNLYIAYTNNDEVIQYQEKEISISPYPGLACFKQERLTRKETFGKSGTKECTLIK